MAYFLVMGGLALTVCFTFGWAVWRILRWAAARLGRRTPSGGKKKSAARAPKGQPASTKSSARASARASSKAPARASSKAPAREKERASSTRRDAAAQKEAARRDKTAEPSRPWRLTVALAPLRGAWPLAALMGVLYGGGRLIAHGMVARPQHAPDAFRQLVEAVGWGAAGLLGIAALGGLATWRCRRQ